MYRINLVPGNRGQHRLVVNFTGFTVLWKLTKDCVISTQNNCCILLNFKVFVNKFCNLNRAEHCTPFMKFHNIVLRGGEWKTFLDQLWFNITTNKPTNRVLFDVIDIAKYFRLFCSRSVLGGKIDRSRHLPWHRFANAGSIAMNEIVLFTL